jgi:hypothetical protein
MMSMLRSNQRNSMGFYSSLVVDVCKIALFPSLKNASQLVASSPNFGQVRKKATAFKFPSCFFPQLQEDVALQGDVTM